MSAKFKTRYRYYKEYVDGSGKKEKITERALINLLKKYIIRCNKILDDLRKEGSMRVSIYLLTAESYEVRAKRPREKK